MSVVQTDRNKAITDLLNGILLSLKSVVPIDFQTDKPELSNDFFHLEFGVLIGITGDIKGKLVLTGETDTFGAIGEVMFGMPLEGDMLSSFSGELGNMIAGGLSTNIIENGVKINITSPTIMKGDTEISGHNQALKLPVIFQSIGKIDVYLLLD